MGIEHRIRLRDGQPHEDVVQSLLMSLPHFLSFDTNLGLYYYGADGSPACWISTEIDGFLHCDHLCDRKVACDVLDALVAALESSGGRNSCGC